MHPAHPPAASSARGIEQFEAACAVARRAVPTGLKQGHDFAQACVQGAKIKAELLSKTLSSTYPHHALLDLSAALRGFQSWHELNQFARKFANTDDAERGGWPQSLMMAIALWKLTPADEKNPLVQDALERTLETLVRIAPQEIDRPAAELIMRRIMFQKDTEREYSGENKRIMERVMHGLHGYLGVNPKTIVLWLLTKVPVVEGRRAAWPPLNSIAVAQLMAMPLANDGSQVGFGYEGWAHAVVYLYNELESIYAKYGPAAESYSSHLGGDERALKRLTSEIGRAVSSPLARIICRDFLTETLKPCLTMSVESMLTREVDGSGFYSSFYAGPPEKVESDWAGEYRLTDPTSIKRVVFREPFGEFQLSIFRMRRWFESNGPRLYEFEAVLHDSNDDLIAKLGLALFIGEGQTSPEELAWCLDEHDHDDLREAGLGLAQAAYAGRIDGDLLDRVMVLREWEVREDHRGQGLGKKLLYEAIRRSIRGLATPALLACRLCPLKLEIHPYLEWVTEAERGADTVIHRELVAPVLETREIFKRSVGTGTFVADKKIELFDVPFLPWLHRGRNDMTLLAMSLARPPTKAKRRR
jgi:GNAT superfamily N-acetyltransferase